MRVRIAKERSDLTDLVTAAIKTTYHTRSPGGVGRCIDVLNQLMSLSLSVKDLRSSESIVELETLTKHRNPKIRKEAKALFHSWSKTFYTQGRNDTFESALAKFRLKPKKHVLTICSELKTKEEGRYLTREAEEIKKECDRSQTLAAVDVKKKINFLELNKKKDETNKIKKKTKTNLSESNKEEDHKTLTCEVMVDIEKETKTDLKTFNLKKTSDDCEAVLTKQPRGAVKIAGNQKTCSVTSTALPQHSRQNIKDKDGQVTNKTLIPPPRRDDACKNVTWRSVYREKQHQTGDDSTHPKSAALKNKTEEELKKKKKTEIVEKKKTEFVELFEAAKKAADLANAKGILLGKPETSRCVEALTLLMRINITPKPKEPRRMVERLEGLTKHKDRKICSAASALLHLWRQRIRDEQRKDCSTKTFPKNSCKTHK